MHQNIIINSALLREFSPIPLNYNTAEIVNYIKLAEITWVLPIIGKYLYEELLYQVKNNNLTPENGTLLVEALYPYLGFCVAYEALPTIAYKITEVGVVKSDSDNSKSVDSKEYSTLETHLRRQIEGRKEYLVDWLCKRCQSFPLFDPSVCGGDCPCNKNKGLKDPQKLWQIYGMPYKDVDIK